MSWQRKSERAPDKIISSRVADRMRELGEKHGRPSAERVLFGALETLGCGKPRDMDYGCSWTVNRIDPDALLPLLVA